LCNQNENLDLGDSFIYHIKGNYDYKMTEERFNIPQSKIEEIKLASDIQEVVSDYVMLKKKGLNYFGLCPFHSEKTPSFSVNTEKQIFHCFGCGEGGGVINFIMKVENLTYPEAIKFLARKKGIEIQFKQLSKQDEIEAKQKETLYSALRKASEVYQMNLLSENGKQARELIKNRGLSDNTIKLFKLGYSMNSWDDLVVEFKKSKIALDLAEKAGLILPKKDKTGYYDRFRHRIMFPIFDLHGRVVAFGGRIMKDAPDEPKYINSPETRLYHKGYILYGLNFTAPNVREAKSIILVEGYYDLISLVNCGIENAAATLGTALTNEHAMLIKRYTDTVYLFFDSDDAGIKAAFRGIDLLIGHGFTIKVAVLPKGDDPDSLARKEGKKGISNIIDNSKPYMQFYIENKCQSIDLSSPKEQLHAILEVIPILSILPNPIERLKYIGYMSEMIKVDKSIIIDEMNRVLKKSKKRKKEVSEISHSSSKDEQTVLGLISSEWNKISPDILEKIKPELFKSKKIKEAFILLKSTIENSKDSNIISFDEIDDSESKRTLLETISTDWSKFVRDQTILDFITKSELSLLKKESKELTKKIEDNKSSEKQSDDDLLKEKMKITKKIHKIDEPNDK
jgi:DNA primase